MLPINQRCNRAITKRLRFKVDVIVTFIEKKNTNAVTNAIYWGFRAQRLPRSICTHLGMQEGVVPRRFAAAAHYAM